MLPIRDTIPTRYFPLATWTVIGANVLVFAFELRLPDRQLEAFLYLFGIVPARYSHPEWAQWVGFPIDDYWPFLTSMFLHGGWMHIIGNMWTLWIFGDNVEDRMGPGRFLVFYLLCGVIAGVVHLLLNASSTVPTVGASGAIAGVLGAYFVLFPRAYVIALFPIFFYPLFFAVPAAIYLLVWFGMQFLSGTAALLGPEDVGGVAWWAHIAGFVAGATFVGLFLDPSRQRRFYRDKLGYRSAWGHFG